MRSKARRAFAPVAVWLLVAIVSIVRPPLVRAGTEEWSTFDPEATEFDDESMLDHYLTRTPLLWRGEWEHSRMALRTAQGCLTSGEWFVNTDLKLHAPLGDHAEFGLLLRQSETDIQHYNYVDFQFRFPTTHYGTPGAWFRPLFDKSRQDFALTWSLGADTTAQQLDLAFAFEDVFNNLWAFRQSQVGGTSEPYERHPYEPGLHYVARQRALRFEASGRYLTPSRKRVIDYAQPVPQRIQTLWGTLAEASLEVQALGLEWDARTYNQQAFSTDAPVDGSVDDAENFRRMWFVEGALRKTFGDQLTAESHYFYIVRDTRHGPPFGPSNFGGIDRMVTLEGTYAFTPRFAARAGGLYDRIGIGEDGPYHVPSYGTRTESRAYIGLIARFGRVAVSGVEGIELDPEPYDVWFVHDKGFLQLQTTF
jgi:hypothetical protein